MAIIAKHGSHNDWCHLCGNRSPTSVDVFYPENAEHATVPNTKYVRICKPCAFQIIEVSDEVTV